MFRPKTIVFVIGLLAMVGGCARTLPAPNSAQLANADFGPVPEFYKEQIEVFWSSRLIDPQSAVFKYAKPIHGFTQRRDNRNTYGWTVLHTIKAKTRSNRFAKPRRYAAFFIDGRLSHVTKTVKEGGIYPLVGTVR